MRAALATSLMVGAAVILAACADGDNPTAVADLNLVAEVDLPGHVHSMTSAAMHVRVHDGGTAVHMHRIDLEVVPPGGAAPRSVSLTAAEDGFTADVPFYASGEHHLRLRGQPSGHHLMRELGEHEVHVVRTHIVAGDHRFELETSPAPILEGGMALLHLFAFELEEDGSTGHEAEGLDLEGTLHFPGGAELPIAFAEHGHGEYLGQAAFPVAGAYGLQVGLVAGQDEHEEEHEGGGHTEFEIPVPSLSGDQPANEEEEGDGHGH